MTRPTLRLDDGHLLWSPDGGAPERRPLTDDDAERLHDWAERYRRGLTSPDPDAFAVLGREIFAWLDGDDRASST